MFRKPWQLSPENNLQKSMRGAPVEDGKPYDAIVVLDETLRKGEDGHEFIVYANKAELRQALLDAEQRGDVRILPSDASLIDSNRIRKSVAEILYPQHDWAGVTEGTDGRPGWTGRGRGPLGPDGNPMVKSKATDVVRDAYGAYTKEPGADIRAAAAELDALIERQRRG